MSTRAATGAPRGAPATTVRVELRRGLTVAVNGDAASLVTLLATAHLSQRTLAVLHRLAAHDRTLATLPYARLEVDLTPARARLYYRRVFDHVELGEGSPPEEPP